MFFQTVVHFSLCHCPLFKASIFIVTIFFLNNLIPAMDWCLTDLLGHGNSLVINLYRNYIIILIFQHFNVLWDTANMTNFIKIYPVVAEILHLEIRCFLSFLEKIQNFQGLYLWNFRSNFDEIFYPQSAAYQIWSKFVIVVLTPLCDLKNTSSLVTGVQVAVAIAFSCLRCRVDKNHDFFI